jgi:hypothetical protein
MNEIKTILLKRARDRHQLIQPCYPNTSFDDCFTVEDNKVLFWYNTIDQSTHVDYAELV